MDSRVVLIIIGMALVTYIPRALPIIGLSKIPLPSIILKWLSFIPVAVLSALLLPSLVVTEAELNLNINNSFLLASIPAIVVAFWKRSLLLTVVVGMVAVVLIGKVM